MSVWGGTSAGDSSDGADRLYRWVSRHPLLWSAIVSSIVTLWALLLVDFTYVAVWICAGLLFAGVNWFLVRPGGPGHRWRAALMRRYEKRRSAPPGEWSSALFP